MKEIHHWIDGKEYKGTSGRFSDVYNPATGEVQARLSLITKAEMDDAIARAAKAQIAWGATNPQRRARVMMAFVGLINRDMDKLAEALSSAVPVIVSSNCGAADLIHPWKDGFLVDPEQTEALTRVMIEMDGDEARWTEMSRSALDSAASADVSRFLNALRSLLPVRLQAAMPA